MNGLIQQYWGPAPGYAPAHVSPARKAARAGQVKASRARRHCL